MLYFIDNKSNQSSDKPTDEVAENNEDNIFIAFARIYSGTVRKGQKLYVLGPKHDPAKALEKVILFMIDMKFYAKLIETYWGKIIVLIYSQ